MFHAEYRTVIHNILLSWLESHRRRRCELGIKVKQNWSVQLMNFRNSETITAAAFFVRGFSATKI